MHAFNRQHRSDFSRAVLISLLLCLLAPTAQSAAPQTGGNNRTWTANRTLEAADSGLIYSLPVVNQKQLANEIHHLNQQLKHRREDLNQRIEQNHFTATDAVIIAVVPGGLLYAAVKKQRMAQAERELHGVVSQLNSLADFRPAPQHPMIASR